MNGQIGDRFRLPRAFWRAAEGFGLPASALLRQARLPARLHVTPEGWLTTAQYFALWRAVEALSQDPAIGLRMTIETPTPVHPPATMAAFFARDYRDGLHRLARFRRLCTPEELTLTEAGAECRIAIRWPFAAEGRADAATDVTFAAIRSWGGGGPGGKSGLCESKWPGPVR